MKDLRFSVLCSLYYKESPIPFLIPLSISMIVGILLNNLKPKNKNLYAQEKTSQSQQNKYKENLQPIGCRFFLYIV